MDLFIQSSGGDRARSCLAMCIELTENPEAVWSIGIQEFAKNLAKLVYPLNERVKIGKKEICNLSRPHYTFFYRALLSRCLV